MKALIFILMIAFICKCVAEPLILKNDTNYSVFRQIVSKKLAKGAVIEYQLAPDKTYQYYAPRLDLNNKYPWHAYLSERKPVAGYSIIEIDCISDKLLVNRVAITSKNVEQILPVVSGSKLCIIIKCKDEAMPFHDAEIFDQLYKRCEGRYLFGEAELSEK